MDWCIIGYILLLVCNIILFVATLINSKSVKTINNMNNEKHSDEENFE